MGQQRHFPLISKYNKNGVRMFSNDLVGETVFIDKTALEDAIEFQSIDFDVIDGYYFNEGRNDKVKEVIKHLYGLRRNLEKRKEPSTNRNGTYYE